MTVSAQQAAELGQILRDEVVESRLLGSAVTIDTSGQTVISLGKPDSEIFPRSTLKPFQAIASLRRGAQLTTPQLALAAGSHQGSEYHQSIAASTLTDAGLNASTLQCPASWPSSTSEAARMAADLAPVTLGPRRLAHNCSGKHAAFLASCVASGDPVENYLSPDHPLQRLVLEVLTEYTGFPVTRWGGDGCGAPAPLMPLEALATGYHRLIGSLRDRQAESVAVRVVNAMLDEPAAVAGPGQPDTVMMKNLGWLSKLGAEGVAVVAAPDGTTTAVKMLGGSGRGAHTVALALNAYAVTERPDPNLLNQVLTDISPKVTSGGQSAGRFRLGPAVLNILQASSRRRRATGGSL